MLAVITDTWLLSRFISEVISQMGEYFHARVFLRLSMFDGQLNPDELQLKSRSNTAMAAQIADIRYDDNTSL